MFSTNINTEVERYLTTCYKTAKPTAQDIAADFYEKQDLPLLTPEDQRAKLNRLDEGHQKEAEILNRPLYLSEADNPKFLLEYFGTGHHTFTILEEKKFQEAMNLYEKIHLNELLMAEVEVEIEKKEIGERCLQARSRGEQPDRHDVERMSFLLAHGKCSQAKISTLKVASGPKRIYTFGYLGPEGLLKNIGDDLTAEIGFLRPPTTTDIFVAVAMAKDLSIVRTPLYFGCQNIQLIYVKKYFKSLFSSFTSAVIGHSGLFYSRFGTLFNAHHLNCTVEKHIPKKYAIDAIFKKYGIAKPTNL